MGDGKDERGFAGKACDSARLRADAAPAALLSYYWHALDMLSSHLFVLGEYHLCWRDAALDRCRLRGCGRPLDCIKCASRCGFRAVRLALSVKCDWCLSPGNGPLVFVRRQRTPWRRCGASGEPSLPRRMDSPFRMASVPASLQSCRHARRHHSPRVLHEISHGRYICLYPLRSFLLVDYRQQLPIDLSLL